MTAESIRAATLADLAAIDDIYHHYVRTSVCTLQLTEGTRAEREAWFHEHERAGLPVRVLEDERGRVLGWSSLSRFSPREGYRITGEDSVYLHPDATGAGRGRRLLEDLLDQARALPIHSVVARIVATQPASLRLHERMGFIEVGRLPEVGHKFGVYVDVVLMLWRNRSRVTELP